MTTTITPEEREQWRRETELPSYAIRQEHRRIVRLLEALETAEKERDFLAWVSQPLADLYQEEMSRADKAESERDWLFANVNRACPPEKLRFIDCGEVRENENYPCRRCWQRAAQEAARRIIPNPQKRPAPPWSRSGRWRNNGRSNQISPRE